MKLSDRIEQMVGPINGLPADFDKMIDQWFGKPCRDDKCAPSGFSPRANIVEQEKQFVVTMELPGVSIEQVAVETANEQLKISGEKQIEELNESDKIRRNERVVGKFERSFEFRSPVDFDRIEAGLRHGVLTIRVPKSEKVLPRKIQVSGGE